MKGLFISYHYNPVDTANAIQNHRFIEGVSHNNVDIQIITRMEGGNVPVLSLDDPYSKKLNYLARHTVPELFYLPDIEYFTWILPLKRKIDALVDFSEIDFIYTNSIPHSTHLLGAYLKKEFKKPWIAHFLEAWTVNNYRKFRFDKIRRLHEKGECLVAENADLIIHTNSILKQAWVNKYGRKIAEKIEVLPSCTDSRIVAQSGTTRENKKFTIVHAGGIYGQRNLNEFIKAIKFLIGRALGLEKILDIQILGIVSPTDRSNIIANHLEGLFSTPGKLDYNTTQEYLRNADLLLVIDALDTADYVFFPSKLSEYFSYKKPILGITPRNSACRELLTLSGHAVFGKDEYMKIGMFIEDMILKKRSLNFDENFYKNLLPDFIGAKFREFIDRIAD